MTMQWPAVPLSNILIERREAPTPDDLALERVRIVSKIVFDTGHIELRTGFETKTGMILARPGDLLVSGINAAKGAIAIYGVENTEPIAATIHYGAYTPIPDRADLRFLWWFFRSQSFRELLSQHVPGGIKTELKPKRLLPIPIPLPPLAEQKRVVARIEGLASRLGEAKKLRQSAVAMIQVAHSKAMDSLFLRHSNNMVPIGTTFRVSTGGTPSRSNPEYWDGDVKWVSSGEVAFCRIRKTRETITSLGVQESNAKVYPPSTVLLAMIGQGKTRGQCAILECHAATNQNVAAIHVYETEHSPEYVYWWLFANYQKSRAAETGTAQPALSGERVKQMLLPLPPVRKQRQVVAELETLQAEVNALKRLQSETAAELGALLPAILDRAFKGEF